MTKITTDINNENNNPDPDEQKTMTIGNTDYCIKNVYEESETQLRSLLLEFMKKKVAQY